MTHEELKESLGLAALDLLERAEAAEVEAHLGSCSTCRRELAELRESAGLLGLAAAPVAPPADLRARLLDGIAIPVTDHAVAASPRTTTWRAIEVSAALAAGTAICGLLMYSWGLATRARTIESQLSVERERAVFLASPDTATVVLAGTEQAPQARLKLAYDRHSGRALLFGFDLPPPPPGNAYQMWFIAGGKALPGRVFTPDATGRGWWSDEVPAEGREASIFAVTLEPAGGTSEPTGPMILRSVALS